MAQRQLNDWLDGFMEYTKPMECCDAYCIWSGIATLSTVLERKCRLEHGADLAFYPNFYIALVGPSGNRKTEALRVGLRMLEENQVSMGVDSTTASALFDEMIAAYKANYEESGGAYGHASYAVFAEELSTFLRPAKVDVKWHEALIKLYDCGPYKHRTVTDGLRFVEKSYLTLFGGITPDGINKAIPPTAVGAGLTGRMIFVWSDTRGVDPNPERYNTPERRTLRSNLKADLRAIHNLRGNFSKTSDFQRAYELWYIENAKVQEVPGRDFDGYNSRRGAHLMKLATISSASRRDGNRQVNEYDFSRAMKILSDAERDMPRSLSHVTRDDLAQTQQYVIDLLRQASTALSVQQIYSRVKGDVSYENLKKRVLPALTGSGECVTRVENKDILYMINPNFKPFIFDNGGQKHDR